ncbi:adenylate/guanylate cyclase [Nostoc commune NIES-4072]|uniref:Adenylate/guanylate cyclase n=1 Tax=Nostoc commune NIES-4072 TaxID=2005467 RepID=A0A2R5FX30_NOSCO|nr:adenylate/guanylate cyclase domain-containing protein [Nostoc commune]BBD70615.1 adenylate/guanylate cyclase [Nostoc commune HK-02]GBG23270.1 adenylate/guanylate cyclase [Nostoc commune NIES-4072]
MRSINYKLLFLNRIYATIKKASCSKKFRLRTVLIVPFIIPIIASTGLVGWFSFRNGQQAIDDLAIQLNGEITARIKQHVLDYLNKSYNVLKLTDAGIQSGNLKLDDFEGLQRYFWQVVRQGDLESYLYFGNEKGEFVGVEHREDGTIQLRIRTKATEPMRETYLLDDRGDRQKWLKSTKYDTTSRPWYKAAVQARIPTWSPVYPFFSRENTSLGISPVRPVYDSNGKLLGVLSINITLMRITNFLKQLYISPHGQSFIMEPSGHLVVSSTIPEPFKVKGGEGDNRKIERMPAADSQNATVTATARYLRQHFDLFEVIKSSQHLKFQINGVWHYVQVMPIQDGRGINWLAVVVVPENDFMAQINANTRTTILLCVLTSAAATAIGVLASRWISHQIFKLNTASQEIASGNLDQHVEVNGIIEIERLANSFNRMAFQLQESFERLETQKNSFARFFPPEYLKFLNKHGVTDIELGDHVSKEMAVMFSDIRSFTTLSEKMTPKENFDFVNAYLRQVSPEIRAHDGFVVKFLGDGMMAVFPNGVDDAVAAGVDKFKRVQKYNRKLESQGYLPIDVGMGIHFGHMMVGMVGEHNRIQGDAFSDNVNLTARLEGLTKFYGVSLLISEEVLERLSNPEQYKIRFLDRAIVKGRTEPIAVYEVLDAETEAIRELKLDTLQTFERGIQHYCRGNFTDAKACFEQVLAVNPLDKTTKLYLERVQELLLEGTPANWNGVWAFTQK